MNITLVSEKNQTESGNREFYQMQYYILVWNNKIRYYVIVLFILGITGIQGCRKDTGKPVITTLNPANITSSTATSGGSIISNSGSEVTESGVCWSPSANPTVNDSKSTDGSRIGKYVSSLTGLAPLTKYYLRSYASNEAGISYGSEESFVTSSSDSTIADIDGNLYGTVVIGNQVWMKENLKTTRYENGDIIGTITLNASGSDLADEFHPKYQWEFDIVKNWAARYGRLYTWFTATDNRKLCPIGWHLPSDEEWTILSEYLENNGYGFGGSGSDIAQSMSAGFDWAPSGIPGSAGYIRSPCNKSGFSGLPTGFINESGNFQSLGEVTYWWSASEVNGNGGPDIAFAYARELYYPETSLYRDPWGSVTRALSVRCLKDQ